MNILRQLLQDAQSVLRDMSVTQRVAVTFLVLSVAVWLTFASWMGTTPGETGRRPLPMEVEPADSNELLNQLKAKGITSADYDFDSRRILVNVDEEKTAVIALAEDGLLKDAHAFGFLAMLDKWSFSDTRMKSEESMRVARANEVARLIENIEPVREAQVIYSDDTRSSLFGVAHKKTAAVRVKTKLKKPLTEDTANTIIAIVSSAKAGLDPRDVVVTDQNGNKFHSSAANGLSAMAKQKWDTEFSLAENMRRQLENLMRQYIPNIQYEGDVNAFPKFEVVFDYKEQMYKEVLPGEVGSSATSNYSQVTSQRPSEEPGVQPNVRRVENLSNPNFLYINESTTNQKTTQRTMQNSIRETATKFSPHVSNLTISAIIHLPYQLRRDTEGRYVQAVNELGDALLDPETNMPMWERESVPNLSAEKMEELKRQIAQAAGIALADIPEKIELSQVPWTPPVYAPIGAESRLVRAQNWFTNNAWSLFMLALFMGVGIVILRYALRPIPTEIDEPIEAESISLAMTHEEEDEEMGDEEWDKLRAKVTAAVQEDPKRAAGLLKRWMRKD